MKLAFLYAGQGSQKAGMGRDFYEAYPSIRPLFESASLEFDLKTMCFENPDGKLDQTRYTQPCMVAFAAAVTQLFYENGIVPDAAAGLSLGEYSALHAAGVFDAQTAISLTAYRGAVMEETTRGMDSKMVAVLGLAREKVERSVQQADGAVDIANINCTGQIVIGGEAAAVDRAADIAKMLGAKRCLPLNVSGPFHTRFMEEASQLLSEKLRQTPFLEPKFPVYHNVTGGALADGMSIKEALVLQIKRPVQFEATLLNLADDGFDTVVEIGPGKVLSGFVRKTAPQLKAVSVETAAEFLNALTALKGGSAQ